MLGGGGEGLLWATIDEGEKSLGGGGGGGGRDRRERRAWGGGREIRGREGGWVGFLEKGEGVGDGKSAAGSGGGGGGRRTERRDNR